MTTKICIKCHLKKDFTEFAKNKGSKRRRLHCCKECNNQIAKDKRKTNPEESRKYHREYYAKNRERCIMHRVNYNKRNRKKVNKNQRDYYAKHFSKNIAETGWEGIKRSILKRDNFTCQKCGRKTNGVYHKDGSGSNTMVKDMNNDPNNLIVFCPKCCLKETFKRYKGDTSKGKWTEEKERNAQIENLAETISLADIGRKFNITRQRVAQIVNK